MSTNTQEHSPPTSGSPAPSPSLTTARLTLRALTMADAPQISLLAGAWNVARMTGSIPSPYPLLAAEGFLMLTLPRARARGNHVFAITMKSGAKAGQLIGVVGLHGRGPGVYELGYWLGEPYWGQGLAFEAAQAVLDWGMQALPVTRLVAGHYVDNPASAKVLSKLGFVVTGPPTMAFSLARGESALCAHLARPAKPDPKIGVPDPAMSDIPVAN